MSKRIRTSLGFFQHKQGHAGHARHIQTKALWAFAFDEFVQKYDLVALLICLVGHVVVLHARIVLKLI